MSEPAEPAPPPLDDPLYAALGEGVSGTAGRVVVGLNWTLVEGPEGVGLAHTEARGTGGCDGLPEPGEYAGCDLAELARLTASDNIFERSIALAAINAHHNRWDLEGEAVNGLDLVEPRGEKTVVIGRFPDLDERLPGAAGIERKPGPGNYPEAAAETLLPAAEHVLITAATLVNGSLPRLLELGCEAFVVLVGPSVPLAPVLFDFGVDAASGFVVIDTGAALRTVMEGGAVQALKRHGRYVTVTK